MKPYVQNLRRLEFMITLACTGRCRHCSEGDHTNTGDSIDSDAAVETVRRVAGNYNIESLMTFGGEPLLYPDTVYKIHAAARDMGIPKRQLITNGFFSRDGGKIREVAGRLVDNGVNDICLSVDAFHQETIPLEPVLTFAREALEKINCLASKRSDDAALRTLIRLRVNPAWLVSVESENPYNDKTREILKEFQAIGVESSDGNIVFPSGNALKYFGEYFDLSVPHVSPYAEDPKDIRAICVDPNGDVLDGNIYQTDILDLLANYEPAEE